MPFNIDLTTTKTPIKIQIVKNVLTVYFHGEALNTAKIRDNWSHLNSHFDMPEYDQSDSFLPSSAHHEKQEHTNTRETTLMHVHNIFQTEITPEILSYYLHQLYQQQLSHSEEYQFFESIEEVNRILDAFTQYYQSYKGSSIEADYEEGTKLTEKEHEEYKEQLEMKKIIQHENRRLIQSFMASSPFFGLRPNRQIFNEDANDNFNVCPIS